jgi:hypothetical protein
MNSEAKYSQKQGRAFNEDTHRTFYPVTDEEIQEARKRRFELMNQTRESLGPMSQTDQEE